VFPRLQPRSEIRAIVRARASALLFAADRILIRGPRRAIKYAFRRENGSVGSNIIQFEQEEGRAGRRIIRRRVIDLGNAQRTQLAIAR